MEEVHGVGPAHEHIPDAGDDVHGDVVLHAVFQQDVPVVAVDAAKKDSFHLIQQALIY